MIRLTLLVDGETVKVESAVPVSDGFAAPTLEECRAYWSSESLRGNADAFHGFYASRAWTSKGTIVRDWHRLAASWSSQERDTHTRVGMTIGGVQW